MGIFSSYAEMSGLTEGTEIFNEADLAEEMERLEEMESAQNLSDDPEEACIEAMMIGQENFHNLVMNITNEEVQYMLENGGEEVVYEGTRLDTLLDKIRSLIDKAWEKIKAIFEKALAAINSWISTDKRFIQKFAAKIKSSSDEARTIRDTYEIDPGQIGKDSGKWFDSYATKLKSLIYDNKLGAKKVPKEKIYSEIFTGATNTQEVLTNIERVLGLENKTAKVTLKPDQIISELKDGKDNKKAIKLAYDNARKAIAKLKKIVEEKRSDAKKKNSNTDNYSTMITGINLVLSIMSSIQRLQIRACNIYHSNCRKAAARAVRGVQDVKESMEVYEDETDFAWLQ